MRLPTPADIAARRRELFKQSILDRVEGGGLEEFLLTVEELSEEHDPAEVAAAALKLLWEQQKGGPVELQSMDGDGERAELGMTRLFLTAGRNQGVRPGDLVGAISNEAGIPGKPHPGGKGTARPQVAGLGGVAAQVTPVVVPGQGFVRVSLSGTFVSPTGFPAARSQSRAVVSVCPVATLRPSAATARQLAKEGP